ncbi:MAG: hypothetical protein GWP74_19990 [Proteobacteria bacterium]|nr:hypothetical protein [Pseudomonadota bacterium]
MYGNRWSASFGNFDQNDTWLAVLQGLTPQQIADGLAATPKTYPEWPPTVGQFRGLCRGTTEPAHRALPKPEPMGRTEAGKEAARVALLRAQEYLDAHGNDDIAAARDALGDQNTPEANAMRRDLSKYEKARARR